MSNSNSRIIGAVVLSRHGDRSAFYQDADTYEPKDTAITPLGENQAFQLGQTLASLYTEGDSSIHIPQLRDDLLNKTLVEFIADGGGEGGVVMDSAAAIAQGMWPADPDRSTTLANGTTITSPLGGYQYVSIASIEPEQSAALEGWTDCDAFAQSTQDLYDSDEFKQKGEEMSSFFDTIRPIVNGRPVSMDNFYNVFDYMNVQSIHNETFLNSVDDQIMEEARDLVNWHQFRVFSSPDLGSVHNMPGRSLLPTVFGYLDAIAADTDESLRFAQISLSYKPFLALTNMFGITDNHPELEGMIDYAGSMTFELHQPESGDGDQFIRFGLKNGTQAADYTYYTMLGTEDITLAELESKMDPYTISTRADWCSACNNDENYGCSAISAADETWSNNDVASGQSLSPLAAGFIGASVTLAVLVALFAGFLARQSSKQKKAAALATTPAAGDQAGSGQSGSNASSINEKH